MAVKDHERTETKTAQKPIENDAPLSLSFPLNFDALLPHAPARVFRALTDPAALSAWLLPVERNTGNDETEPRVGAKWTFRARPENDWDGWDVRIACEVTDVCPPGESGEPGRLSYTWRALNAANDPAETRVTWTVTPEDDNCATRLRLTHEPLTGPVSLGGGGGALWAQTLCVALARYLGGAAVTPFRRGRFSGAGRATHDQTKTRRPGRASRPGHALSNTGFKIGATKWD